MLSITSDHLERTRAWGQASDTLNYVYRPTTIAGVREVFQLGQKTGMSVGLRGAGQSYGDAALNSEQLLLDLSCMNRVLGWNPAAGIITVEPGVTIAQLWRYVLGDGWWPPVVSGTMFTTLGGSAAMNIHGKNNWQAGPIGAHILEFRALLPTGEVIRCSREENADLFLGFVGSFGMLGCFTSLTLKLKRVYSGRLQIQALPVPNIATMLAVIEDQKDDVDYLVGWVDGLAAGRSVGRGQIHIARYLAPGEDPVPQQSLRLENQELPSTLLRVMPRGIMWRILKPFVTTLGLRLINFGKYWAARGQHRNTFQKSLAEFNFLLDYIPNWKKAYLPGGLIQYQSFLPKDTAADAFRNLLTRSRAHGMPTTLGVVKRHRPDDFLISYSLDGFSLAMDLKVTQRNRERLVQLAREMDRIVLDAGGRFYFAKDSTLHPEAVRAFLGAETIYRLAELKQRCDPEGLLQTNLSRRVLPELHQRCRQPTLTTTIPVPATMEPVDLD